MLATDLRERRIGKKLWLMPELLPERDVLAGPGPALPAAGPLLALAGRRRGVYLVGGAVRDLLLGGVPFDLDLVVEGRTQLRSRPSLGGG